MSPLEALAPDQRAVVQLVLQQGRSYADLAGLLGIGEDAVRRRAYKGLSSLAPGHGLPQDDQEEIADFLLGQQTVSEREDTREFLADSATARAWARAVAGELEAVAPDRLPEIPGDGQDDAPAREPEQPQEEPEPIVAAALPVREPADAPDDAPAPADAEDWLEDDDDFAPTRPAPKADAPKRDGKDGAEFAPPPPPGGAGGAGQPRSSRLGGLLLIGALALIIAAVIVLLVNRGDDGEEPASDEPTTTQTTPSAAEPQVLAQINMRGSGTARKAIGVAQIFVQGDSPAFQLLAQDVPANKKDEAYGIWLYSSADKAVRLGFTPVVEKDGNLRVGNNLPPEFTDYEQLVVSREKSDDAKRPGPIILRGAIPKAQGE